MAKSRQPKSGTAKETKITYIGGEDAPAYYSNNTRVETSRFDVRLRLGQLLEVDKENNSMTVRSVAEIRMSLVHAKVVAGFLAQQIGTYEKEHGKIPGGKK